ncbi:MAG TPA: tetratricopeptide repeat protein [Longimicrobium sp.]|jgi:tetratricopeptide (TPR) repeat protein|nr:tetratricopeptide repeat protein [Longimicrobium sp.]
MKKILALALAAVAACAAAAGAQRVRDVPPRPALWAGADTNSAGAYYLLGVQRLERDARTSAAAFFWAERLAPGWPDALYGRHVALLMSDPHRLERYEQRRGGIERDPEIMAIDSLYLRAVQRDPFLHRKLEKQYQMMYYRNAFAEMIRQETGDRDVTAADYLMRTLMNDNDPYTQAWLAYADGRFPAAIRFYEQVLRRDRHPARLRLRLGQLHYLSGNFAQAAEHLRLGIEALRQVDRRDVVRVYESKAMLEYSLAAALEQAGNAAAAREAYGRALQEDLAFWPGHRRMASLAAASGDTATALSELALAVEIAPNEPDLRYEHGVLLLAAHKVLESAAEMTKAAELDPYFAAPHFYLAAMNDASSMNEDALEHYRHFLARAAQDDAHLAQARQRVAALSAAH